MHSFARYDCLSPSLIGRFLLMTVLAWMPVALWHPGLVAAQTPGLNELVSINVPNTASGNRDSSSQVISADGRYVAFVSNANNLVANDTNYSADIFRRDLQTGTTVLVSADRSGISSGYGDSSSPLISTDGRYVAFVSTNNGLVTNDTNPSEDIFVRDLQTGTTTLVSVSSPNLSSIGVGYYSAPPVMTPDGRYIAYTSKSGDIFVRDLQTSTTILVSVNSAGTSGGNGTSNNPAITPDGRYITFSSAASNLVGNDSNGFQDIFVRDLQTSTTILVSTNRTGSAGGNNSSYYPAINADGRYVVFLSLASDLVASDTNAGPYRVNAFVRDLQNHTTTLANVDETGAVTYVSSSLPLISADGQYFVFTSFGYIFQRNLLTKTTRLVSANSEGTGGGNRESSGPVMTPDGRYVAFLSSASNLVSGFDYPYTTQAFRRDMQTGTTVLVSINTAGTGGSYAVVTNPLPAPGISADGRYVAFTSRANDLVAGDYNGVYDVFVRDLQVGTTKLGSSRDAGNSNNIGIGNLDSFSPSISSDGRYVAFTSKASNLVPNDTNTFQDVFVRDMQTGATSLVSINRTGKGSGIGSSYSPVISSNGRYVVFASTAKDLTMNGYNGPSIYDIFVRDLQAGTTTLVSVNRTGIGGNESSSYPAISADGRYVIFVSSASDLVTNDTNNSQDIFVRDMVTNTTTLVSVNTANSGSGNGASYSSVISANGRYVAFESRASNLVPNDTNNVNDVFVRDLQTSTTMLVSINSAGTSSGNDGSGRPVISADGRYVAFESGARNLVSNATITLVDIFRRDLLAGTTELVSLNNTGSGGGNGFSFSPVISADGRYVGFVSQASNLTAINDANSYSDVFVRDMQSNATTLVSVNSDGTASSDWRSDSPIISADGRYVAFASDSSNLVTNDTNRYIRDVFRRDLITGITTLVSVNNAGSGSGNDRSESPAISADGRYVAFQSNANDLVANDTNSTTDVFRYDALPQPGQLQFSLASYNINEEGGTAIITVTRTGGSYGAVTVNYATSDGTALAGTDYAATSGTLSFANTETSKTFTISILDDPVFEGSETINLMLSNPTGGASLGSYDVAVLAINDNEAQPALSINDVAVAEPDAGTANAIFTVALSGESARTVTVAYATADNTAAAGSDYIANSGTLTFNAGETKKSISIVINSDALTEGNEIFFINLTDPSNATVADEQGVGTVTPLISAGNMIISEFRFRGSNGGLDEFVELYNNTNSDIIVSTTDGSDGWALVASDGTLKFVVPSNTIIKARSHYLGTNATAPGGYSLGMNQAGSSTNLAGDITYLTDIADNTGIALFRTANPANFTLANRLDAVGFSTLPAQSLFYEGAALPAIGTLDGEYSLVRKTVSAGGLANTGRPQDTDNNADDFLFISTTGGSFGGSVASLLGAPGPENLSSPTQRNTQIRATLLDPAQSPAASTNRHRYRCTDADVPAPCDPNTSPLGYLSIRRTYTNLSFQPVTRLRFRIVDISTYPEGTGPSGNNIADVRALSRSSSFTVTSPATGQTFTVQGLTLEQPPNQPSGGGYNSTLVTPTVTLQTPLSGTTPNNRIRVEFLLGIVQGGNFRFLVNVEALP